MGKNGAIIELHILHNDNRASAHSQAHSQFAQAVARTKNCKRACLFSNAFLPTRKNKIGTVLNLKIKKSYEWKD